MPGVVWVLGQYADPRIRTPQDFRFAKTSMYLWPMALSIIFEYSLQNHSLHFGGRFVTMYSSWYDLSSPFVTQWIISQ